MASFILGKKIKMDRIWKDEEVIPVTIIKADSNSVSLLRSKDKHGYEAVQINAPLSKKGIKREFRIESLPAAEKEKITTESSFNVSSFSPGDKVIISAFSRGRGFQGGVKRHGFAGGPKSHGQKHSHRAPGSIGAGGVQKVFKGTRMAGHMGVDKISLKNIEVIAINEEDKTISIKGPVPGPKYGTVSVIKMSPSNTSPVAAE